MPDRTYISFAQFLEGLQGVGFITSLAVCERLDAMGRRGIVVEDGPIGSSPLTYQGEQKALAHLMRRRGYPPVKSTNGKRGYWL